MMDKEAVILIAEDDAGHATLIKRNLRRAGICNETKHFEDGQEVLDFLLPPQDTQQDVCYLLLLDIRMPKVDGVAVLKQLRQHAEYRKMPIIMITTTEDPREVARCHELGCNNYVKKPIAYEEFVEAIQQLGLFLKVVEIPRVRHG